MRAKVDSATVTGRVTSDAGTSVAGANVTIPRLRLTATTNDAGVYRIQIPADRFVAGPDSIRVMRLGYQPSTVRFTMAPGRVTVDITLSTQAVSLEQVLVTGTAGNQERRAQAALVATVDAAELTKQAPISNVTQLLESRVPGVIDDRGLGRHGQRDTPAHSRCRIDLAVEPATRVH